MEILDRDATSRSNGGSFDPKRAAPHQVAVDQNEVERLIANRQAPGWPMGKDRMLEGLSCLGRQHQARYLNAPQPIRIANPVVSLADKGGRR
ncbi:hypothetical protein JM946_13475 [Steroidobacter sp. S1-65]|uniref:Uncharacterized protein n=2 Tax=Steroidobacter gossypii TaxID=2805490 RepID=A0ABS1WXT6_9GAMM|nr:hypothetical protein [Steroidobacter gossypii]